jgi:biopolymer transport protein ExbD
MKTVFSNNGSRPSVDSMLTPMIDVVFLLLIFFLTTSSFQRLEKQLPSASAMPPQQSKQGVSQEPVLPEANDFNDIIIKIGNRNGALEYKLQDAVVADIAQLESRLIAILKIRNDVPIIIDPENSVASGEAIRVYDMIRNNGSLSVFLVAR